LGIIQRQTIRSTIFIYLGIIIGFITSGIIFPRVLKEDEIGLLGILVSYSLILSQFATLGFSSTTIKVFPVFRDKAKGHNGFLFLSMAVSLAGFFLATVAFFIFREPLIANSVDSNDLLAKYINYIIPLVFFTLFYRALDSYYNVLFNAVIGVFVKEFIQRLLIFGIIILFFYELINFPEFVLLYVASLCLPTLILAIALLINGEFNLKPSFRIIDQALSRHIISVSLFGTISGFAGMVIFNIDKIMIERFLGLGPTGIYTTTFYFASLIIMPSRAMLRIFGPIVSQAWNDNNLPKLAEMYHKSTLNLFIAGVLLFAGVWGNVDNIFRILPEVYEEGKYVIFFIGLAYLLDMITGGAQNIIANSKYYRVQTYLMLLLIILAVATNLSLIPILGITGAAIASVISKLVVNTTRYVFLKRKLNLDPYNYKYLIVLVVGLLSYYLSALVPEMDNLILDITLRSLVILISFSILIIITRVSFDINRVFQQVLRFAAKKGS
jgi:O-antigen/teichoic acid export membrane protein